MKTSKDHRSSKATRAAQAGRRSRDDRQHRDHRPSWQAIPIGTSVDPLVLRRSIDAFSTVDLSGPWSDLASMVLPLIKRVRHAFPAELAPLHLRVPPGVWTGFGIDVGPAWAHVSREIIDGWGVDEATLLGTALANLRRRVVEDPPRVERATFADVRATVLQAQGWGSAMILAPDRLGEAIGDRPQILLTPVRNALIALPEDVDVDLAVAIWDAFAEGSGDELDVDPMRWTGTRVASLDDDHIGSLVH